MKKRFFAVALATTMALSMGMTAMADLVTADKTYDGTVKADGSATWASGGTGETFTITDTAVTIVFENDAFVRDAESWSNFIIETIASDSAAGLTLRADAWGWTYGENTTNVPEWSCKTSWGVDKTATVASPEGAEDWTNFQTIFGDTTVTLVAQKTGDNTVEFKLTSAADASAYETYTVTYPTGVPSDLAFQVGADGGVVTLTSATFGSTEAPAGDTETAAPAGDTETAAPAGDTETAAPGTASNGSTTNGNKPGDTAPVAALAVAAVVAGVAAVASKKRVTE